MDKEKTLELSVEDIHTLLKHACSALRSFEAAYDECCDPEDLPKEFGEAEKEITDLRGLLMSFVLEKKDE